MESGVIEGTGTVDVTADMCLIRKHTNLLKSINLTHYIVG